MFTRQRLVVAPEMSGEPLVFGGAALSVAEQFFVPVTDYILQYRSTYARLTQVATILKLLLSLQVSNIIFQPQVARHMWSSQVAP